MNGEFPADGTLQPMRYSDNSVAGETETIEDDTILPDTRVKAIPETGTSKNSGDFKTKWNPDEQDGLLAAVMCSHWEPKNLTEDEIQAGVQSKKELVLGDEFHEFLMVKKWTQAPVEWQKFTHEQVNSVSIAFALKSLVEMTWNLMGSNNGPKLTENPYPGATIAETMDTRAMKTLAGAIYLGTSLESLVQNRQIDDMNVSITNNKETTDALYETEAVEQSDGDFEVTGDFRVLNSGAVGRELHNAALNGETRWLKIVNYRDVDGHKVQYELLLKTHLDKATDSKDGNKFKYQIEWTMDGADGIKFTKLVFGDEPVADVPHFENTLSDVTYSQGDVATALDGTATVDDGGTVTYRWTVDGEPVGTSATYTPDTTTAGNHVVQVTATNSVGEDTATISQSVNVTITEALVNAETPDFSGTLSDATYSVNDTVTALDGTATVTDGGTVTYQWYTVSGGTDTPISGATSATYTPPTGEAGETEYKVVATNTNVEVTGATTATASMTATITVED